LLPNSPELGWTPWAWLIYLVPFVAAPFYIDAVAPYTAATMAATAAFLVLYFAGYWNRGRRLLLIIWAIAAIGCLFLPIHPGAAVFFIYAAAFAAFVDATTRTAIVVIAALCAVLVVEAIVLGLNPFTWGWGLVFSILIGALNVHHVNTSRMNAKLRMAQHEIEHLAKVAERERIARDLHDVIGHTLSLIVLKSELASKLAERDPARAAVEIQDVERIARDALTQIRTALTGYRSAGLTRELEGAHDVLKTAGIDLAVSRGAATFTASEEAVLGLAVREAVTNVLRHSHASNCTVRIEQDAEGRRHLQISDNGTGRRGPQGLGLRGMHERVTAIGGAVTVTGDRGTQVSITLPPLTAERAS
jgi:two-component system sensor histidine kinase DesK